MDTPHISQMYTPSFCHLWRLMSCDTNRLDFGIYKVWLGLETESREESILLFPREEWRCLDGVDVDADADADVDS